MESNIERQVYHLFLVLKLDKVLKEDVCEMFVKGPHPHHMKKQHIYVFQILSEPNIISLEHLELSHNHGVSVKSIVNEGVEKKIFQGQSFEASLKYIG